jgi:hypothetical protein
MVVVGAEICTTGSGFTVTITVAVLKQLKVFAPITV